MRKQICLLFLPAVALLTASDSIARKPAHSKNSHDMQIHMETWNASDVGPSPGLPGFKSSAQSDTTVIAYWTFDAGIDCDDEGWTSHDLTEQRGCYWHIDDFSGLNGGDFGRLNPLEGDQSLWCGARPDLSDLQLCSYAVLPGYGNGWDQSWVFRCIDVPDTEHVVVEYLIQWDSEPGYDYTYLEYATRSTCDSLQSIDDIIIYYGGWVRILSLDDIGMKQFRSDTIPSGHRGAIKIRFHFESDGAWSDEDALWDTDGAVIIDSLTVRAEVQGVIDYEDFEDESPGDVATADGDWGCSVITGYGDFAALYWGSTLLQEDLCRWNVSCMWAFINGSTAQYWCGADPQQIAVPYHNERYQYINNEIWSPMIEWTASDETAELAFDVYRDLDLDAMIFYRWHVRSWVDGCPLDWKDRNFVYYGGQKEWYRRVEPFGDLIHPDATHIQVALGCWDGCISWYCWNEECHSHAPLFDNIEIRRISTTGPVWVVRDIDLFNDTFPENGTSAGTGRIDMANDLLPSHNPNILPGDSAKVTVSDPVGLLEPEPLTGFGSAVYFYMHRDPETKPMPLDAIVEDGLRWPLVDSVMCGGHKWYQFRMDTCFTGPPGERSGPVEDAFCIDIADDYFTNGDTLWFFFGAENAEHQWTYWSRESGTVPVMMEACAPAMEIQILPGAGPARGGDILYVDYFDGRGAQPYFDSAFRDMGILDRVDRFDKRGPSSMVGNGLGYHAEAVQLIDNYRKIIWNSGDLYRGTIGDGDDDKSDDCDLLYEFLQQHIDESGAGVYFSGDYLAYELRGMTSAGAEVFWDTFLPFDLFYMDHKQYLPVTPLGIGVPADSVTAGIFDNGPEEGVDTIVVYGGCPTINSFDILSPCNGSTSEMTYDGQANRSAVIAYESSNALGHRAATVLSGFSFHFIRDDRAAGIPDRADHLTDIVRYLGNELSDPTVVEPVMQYTNSLSQNYPNPFNPSTAIKYSIKGRSRVSLRIYDVTGRLVKTLINRVLDAGDYIEAWNGLNNSGEPVSSGVYFYKLTVKDFTQTRKLVLIR